ncbi:MAG TPA: hypothetical protein ENN68_07625 [Methanomicrobia archaeon]|nr:hypothetical protein [Methanomicrobia archaeon]
MEEGEAEQRGSDARRRKRGGGKETFSISIRSQLMQEIDKEVEEGLWDRRSQAINHYLHRGLELRKYRLEYAKRQLLMLDGINRTDEEGSAAIIFMTLLEKPEFRQLLKQQMEEGIGGRMRSDRFCPHLV